MGCSPGVPPLQYNFHNYRRGVRAFIGGCVNRCVSLYYRMYGAMGGAQEAAGAVAVETSTCSTMRALLDCAEGARTARVDKMCVVNGVQLLYGRLIKMFIILHLIWTNECARHQRRGA